MSPKSKTNYAVTTQIPLAAVAYDFFSWSRSVVCQRVRKLQPFTLVPHGGKKNKKNNNNSSFVGY